jgi:hypothetical protein
MSLRDDIDESNGEEEYNNHACSSSSSSGITQSIGKKTFFSNILKFSEPVKKPQGRQINTSFRPISKTPFSFPSSSSSSRPLQIPENLWKKELSQPERILNILSYANFTIQHHYVPFKYIHYFPIGCSSSHAFGIIKEKSDGAYYPIVMELNPGKMDLPYTAMTEGREFKSPWKKRLEGFDAYLGSCVYNDFVAVVTYNSITVMHATWKIIMEDTFAPFHSVDCCVMNHEFLCVFGTFYKTAKQELLIYRWCFSNKPVIRKVMDQTISSIRLVVEGEDTLLLVNMDNNMGFTSIYRIKNKHQGELGSFIVLDKQTSSDDDGEDDIVDHDTEFSSIKKRSPPLLFEENIQWYFELKQRFVLGTDGETVQYSKVFEDGTVSQITKTAIHSKIPSGEISSITEMESLPIEFIEYTPGIFAIHDSRNAVKFYNNLGVEISVVKAELITEPMRMLGLKVHSPGRYYDSLTVCSDGRTLALLLTYGCLCTILPY